MRHRGSIREADLATEDERFDQEVGFSMNYQYLSRMLHEHSSKCFLSQNSASV
uniref:Uncharacterized protein n=1 Tax=Physcomitrium patens TaxID=3218 RepID=A0A2K1JUB3_PHYPA|nr:hypothetical protein PHYPA_014888 [Physcomitrium patens]